MCQSLLKPKTNIEVRCIPTELVIVLRNTVFSKALKVIGQAIVEENWTL